MLALNTTLLLTLNLVHITIVELKVGLHQVCCGLVYVISNELLDRRDLLYVTHRTEAGSCKCFEDFDSIVFFLLGCLFFFQEFVEFIDDQDGDISVKFLHRIVEHGASCFVDLICFTLAFPKCAFDFVLLVFLHLLLDVQDFCCAFLQYFVSVWSLFLS